MELVYINPYWRERVRKNDLIKIGWFVKIMFSLNFKSHWLSKLIQGAQLFRSFPSVRIPWLFSLAFVTNVNTAYGICRSTLNMFPPFSDYQSFGYRGLNKGFHSEKGVVHVFQKSQIKSDFFRYFKIPFTVARLVGINADNNSNSCWIITNFCCIGS